MKKEWIRKTLSASAVSPNMADYEQEYAAFSWDAVEAAFDGLPSGGLNIAHEAIDRHAEGPLADKPALIWLGEQGGERTFTYAQMKKESARFANVLASLGFEKGERIFTLSTRLPELYIAAIGILKHRSVMCPLFSQFGPDPILQRLERGDARGILTTRRLYEKKIAPLLEKLPELRCVLLIDAEEDLSETVRSLPRLMADAADTFTIEPTDPEAMSLLHFTSGTTGMPKGVIHVHKAIYTHWVTGRDVLDLHPDDVYWCTADPGWVTGTSYGIIA
ncbi:MAG: AMP-binding protein, partial [Campylobacterales bacterium]